MPSKADTEPPPSVGEESISLLLAVCERAQTAFTFSEWRDISSQVGETPEASRQKFNYLVHELQAMDAYKRGKEAKTYTSATEKKKRSAPQPLHEDEGQMGQMPLFPSAPRKKSKLGI